jgi:hypothetical protein
MGAALGLVVLLGLCAAPVACGTDDVGPESRMVGGRCTTNNDCVTRCLVDATDYPGGYCTVGCTTNGDCPAGSACVAREGGVCMATCRVSADCEDYGAGYQCTAQTSQSSGGAPLTCLGG